MKYNILFIDSGSGYGGSAKNLSVIVKYLDRSLFNPVVVIPQIGSQIERMIEKGVKVYRLPILRLSNIRKLRKIRTKMRMVRNILYYLDLLVFFLSYLPALFVIIKKERISLIHGNNGIIDHFPVIFPARLLNIPMVFYNSGTENLSRIEKIMSKWIDHFIVLNPYMEDYYQKNMGKSKVSLIDNGVDLEEVPATDGKGDGTLRQEYGIQNNDIVVGSIARVVPGKGLEIIVKAAREVVERYKNIKFMIIGDNYGLREAFYFEGLKNLVEQLDVSSYIIFTGWQKDVFKPLGIVDIVVQVSTYPEGHSLAAIEAMAIRKPVILSENPGYEKIIIPGESGLRVKVGDAHSLAVAIIEFIENPDLARRIGLKGRKRVEEFLNAGKMVNKIEEVYKSFLVH